MLISRHQKIYLSMDVTFFESETFYADTSVQGESSNDEPRHWEPITPYVEPVPEPTCPTISEQAVPNELNISPPSRVHS